MSSTTVFALSGLVAGLVALSMAAPGVVALVLGEPWAPFAAEALLGAAVTAAAYRWLAARTLTLDHRSAFLVVTASWLFACLVGAVPFLFAPLAGLSPVDALFESVSGFTTTGATVLTGLETRPRSILLWRAMTQWLGGMGIVLIGVAVLPLLGVGGMSLYKAEAPGPTKDKLAPRISETAQILWKLYLGLTALAIVLLWLDGFTVFDSINHAMCAISTGGFSTHDASLGFTDSWLARWTTPGLMILGGTSFAVLYRSLTRGVPWRESPELRAYVALLLVGTLLIAGDLSLNMADEFPSTLEALDHAAFQTASILTTTGFVTRNYDLWPAASHGVLLIVLLIGGMAGSTAGGPKVIRVLISLRQVLAQFFYLIHPRGVIAVRLGGKTLDDAVLASVAGFMALWVALILLGTLGFAFAGMDLLTALTATATTLGNVGPAFAGVGPSGTWADLSNATKLLAAVWMILGRLEVFTVLIILAPAFWRS